MKFIVNNMNTMNIKLFSLFCVMFLQTSIVYGRDTLFVSPSGNGDEYTRVSPGNIAKIGYRLASINKQCDHLVVYLLGGVYELNEPLLITSNEKNSHIDTLTFAGSSSEVAVLSGGKTVSQWKQVKNGVYKAALPSGVNFRQLYVNDKMEIRARFPNRTNEEDYSPYNRVVGFDEKEQTVSVLSSDMENMALTVGSEMVINDAVFGVEINEHLVHQAVVLQLANNRQGTQKAKTRSEVSGGGRKPWRQKGTGHARQGSTRAPQWTGGGVVFAPVPRDYSFKLNKKEKRAALKSVLTSKVADGKFVVVDDLKLDEIKTKKFVEVLNNLKVEKALVVLNDMDTNVIASAANLPTVKTAQTNELNVFDALKYDTVVVTKAAVATIEEVYA